MDRSEEFDIDDLALAFLTDRKQLAQAYVNAHPLGLALHTALRKGPEARAEASEMFQFAQTAIGDIKAGIRKKIEGTFSIENKDGSISYDEETANALLDMVFNGARQDADKELGIDGGHFRAEVAKIEAGWAEKQNGGQQVRAEPSEPVDLRAARARRLARRAKQEAAEADAKQGGRGK